VPVGGKTLHALESFRAHVAHDAQGQGDQAEDADDAPAEHHEAKESKDRERTQGRAEGGVAPGRVRVREGVDQLAGEERHQHVRDRGRHHADEDDGQQLRVAAPLAPEKGEHDPEGFGPAVPFSGHGSIRPHGAGGPCKTRRRGGTRIKSRGARRVGDVE
jgi:hypothetical protein